MVFSSQSNACTFYNSADLLKYMKMEISLSTNMSSVGMGGSLKRRCYGVELFVSDKCNKNIKNEGNMIKSSRFSKVEKKHSCQKTCLYLQLFIKDKDYLGKYALGETLLWHHISNWSLLVTVLDHLITCHLVFTRMTSSCARDAKAAVNKMTCYKMIQNSITCIHAPPAWLTDFRAIASRRDGFYFLFWWSIMYVSNLSEGCFYKFSNRYVFPHMDKC